MKFFQFLFVLFLPECFWVGFWETFWIFDRDSDYWKKILFLEEEKMDFWREKKIGFFEKNWIFGEKKIKFLEKIWIFGKHSDFFESIFFLGGESKFSKF